MGLLRRIRLWYYGRKLDKNYKKFLSSEVPIGLDTGFIKLDYLDLLIVLTRYCNKCDIPLVLPDDDLRIAYTEIFDYTICRNTTIERAVDFDEPVIVSPVPSDMFDDLVCLSLKAKYPLYVVG